MLPRVPLRSFGRWSNSKPCKQGLCITRRFSTQPPPKNSNAPYILVGASSILGGAAYYYWDQIKPHLPVIYSAPPKLEPEKQVHDTIVEIKPKSSQFGGQQSESQENIVATQIEHNIDPIVPTIEVSQPNNDPLLPLAVSIQENERDNSSPAIPLEIVKAVSEESARILISQLQNSIQDELNKASTSASYNEAALGVLQSRIAALAAQLELVTTDIQKSHDHEKQVFQEVLSIQEGAFQARLERVLHDEHVKLEESWEARLKEVEQQESHKLEQKLQEERDSLKMRYELYYRQKYVQLEGEFQDEVAKALSEFEAFIKNREQDVLAQYQHHHQEQLQALQKYNNELISVNTSFANNHRLMASSSKTHSICVALFGLGNALSAPLQTPFTAELAALKAASQGDQVVETLIQPLLQLSNSGVSSYSQLLDRFKAVAQSGRQAALVPDESGIFGNIVAAVASRFIIPEKGLVEGDNPEALFAKAEYYLEKGELGAAVAHMEKLRGMPASIAQDWVVAAKEKLTAEHTLSALQAYIASQYVGK